MQFSILLLGVLIFVFYQFQPPPLFFDSASSHYLAEHKNDPQLVEYENKFNSAHKQTTLQLKTWLKARHGKNEAEADAAFAAASMAQQQSENVRTEATKELSRKNPDKKANDADYVFITFILNELPHGAIGLLVAAFFAAALSSKAAELNALGTSTTIDIYRHIAKREASDEACLTATKWFTALWGVLAVFVALFARLAENLIQAVNILGSIFYGVMLGIFLVAFFVKRIEGNAVFWGALLAQSLVFILYYKLAISYLWFPLIGCAACLAFSFVLQETLGNNQRLIKEYKS